MGCNFPVVRKQIANVPLLRPCGRCMGCRLEYTRGKAIRCVHELEFWDRSSFITLTYDDDCLVYNPTAIAPTVSRRDLQLFFKSLRRKLEPQKISYMASAEYGDCTDRPHYHAIIFGEDFSGDRDFWKTVNGQDLYVSRFLSEAWGEKGYAVIGDVAFESANYVAAYTVKKLSGEKAIEEYDDLGRCAPFGAMSTKPAIGRRWIEKYLYDVYPRDKILSRGRLVRPPRYYDTYLEKVEPKLFEQVMVQRAREGEERIEKNYVASGEDKEFCQSAKFLQKSAKI